MKKMELRKTILLSLVFALVCVGVFFMKSSNISAAERFKKVIYITSKEYGAKSGQDSTKAIQKALDAAGKIATASKRVEVVFPNGVYYIDRTLQISSNTYLKCASGTKILKKSKNCLFMLKGKNSGKVGSYNDLSNITIDGGYWDARYIKRNAQSGGALMYFTHSNNLVIKNATLCHVFGSHLIEIGASNKVSITKCSLYGYKAGVTSGDKEAIQLDICHNSDIEPMAAPYDDTACTNITIENNKIHDYARAIGSHSAVKSVLHKNIIIRNNKIYNITAEALYICNYYNAKIQKNNLSNVAAGIVVKGFNSSVDTMFSKRRTGAIVTNLVQNNYKITIENNTIKTTNKSVEENSGQIGIYIVANEQNPVNGCVIKNNRLSTASNGILLKYADSTTVDGNIITRTNNSSGSKIKYTVDGIGAFSSSDNYIANNQINQSRKNRYDSSIALRTSNNNKVIQNTLSYAKECGIKLAGASSSEITNNTISNSGTNGIAAYDKSVITLDGNLVKYSGKDGLFLYSYSEAKMADTAKRMVVRNNKQNGVSVSKNAKAELCNVLIKSSGKYGIFAYQNATVTSTNCSVLASGSTGININTATASLDHTTIDNSGKYGVAFTNNSTGSIINSTISNSVSTGVYVSQSMATNISGNTIKYNGKRGMDLTSSIISEMTNNVFCNPNADYELRIYTSTVPTGVEKLVGSNASDDCGNYTYRE